MVYFIDLAQPPPPGESIHHIHRRLALPKHHYLPLYLPATATITSHLMIKINMRHRDKDIDGYRRHGPSGKLIQEIVPTMMWTRSRRMEPSWTKGLVAGGSTAMPISPSLTQSESYLHNTCIKKYLKIFVRANTFEDN